MNRSMIENLRKTNPEVFFASKDLTEKFAKVDNADGDSDKSQEFDDDSFLDLCDLNTLPPMVKRQSSTIMKEELKVGKMKLRKMVTITTLGHHCIFLYGEPEHEEKLESYLRGKRTQGELEMKEGLDKYMKQIQEQVEQQKRAFVNRLKNKDGNIPLEMSCVICKGLVYQPMFCGSCAKVVYCEKCVTDWQKDQANEDREKCPGCKEHINPAKLNTIMDNIFNENILMVTPSHGNREPVKYKDLVQYFDNHAVIKLKCPQECGEEFDLIRRAKEHYPYCDYSKHFCYNCYDLLDNKACKNLQCKHDEFCSELKIKCKNRCGKYVKKRDMEKHMRDDCVMGTEPCAVCKKPIERRLLREHEMECLESFLSEMELKNINVVNKCPASRDGRHKIMKCKCSYYCAKCNQFIKKGENLQLLATKCGIACFDCEMVIHKIHKGFKIEKDCSVSCQDCNILYMDFGCNIQKESCGCLYCHDCKKILNNGVGGIRKEEGCGICFRCMKSIGDGHNVVGDVNCALYCQTCKKTIHEKHKLVMNQKGCKWCNECQINRAEGHEIYGNEECGLYCNTCKKQMYSKHSWKISKDGGCPYCLECKKAIMPGCEIVGQRDCGLYCITCHTLVHRECQYFRVNQCAILCDPQGHDRIYKQLKEGHSLKKDGNFWSCENCAKKIDSNDLEQEMVDLKLRLAIEEAMVKKKQ